MFSLSSSKATSYNMPKHVSKLPAVVGLLLIVTPLWDSVIVLFCCALLCVHSSFAIISMGKRELVALLCLPGIS